MLQFELQLHGSLNGGAWEHIDTVQSDKPTTEELDFMLNGYKLAFSGDWEFTYMPIPKIG